MKGQCCLLLVLLVSLSWGQPLTNKVVPCDTLYLRGNACTDMVCGTFSFFQGPFSATVPSNANAGRYVPTPPSDPSKLITFRAYNISSGNSITGRFTELQFEVDAGTLPGAAVGIRIAYDWTGDYTFDRYEYLTPYQTDPFAGFETVHLISTGAALAQQTGTIFIPMNNGMVEVAFWSAFNTSGTLSVRTNDKTYLKIPFQATYALPQTTAVAGPTCQTPPNYPTGQITNNVAFKIQQVQDFFLYHVVMDMMSVFNRTKTPLTLGIIGDSFGTNNPFVQFIRDANVNPLWEVEIGSNGFTFTSWANFSADQVAHELTSFNTMLFNTYRIAARTVIPPSNTNNQYTMDGVQQAGWTHMSSSKTLDGGPYAMTHAPVYRFPHAIEFTAATTATTIVNAINTAVATDGFGVVSLNPSDFSTGGGADVSNPAMLNQLASAIGTISSTKTIVPISRLNTDSTPIPRILLKNCNCIAFRLDDVQDFFVTVAQKAIINAFKQAALPLTIGIIGSKFGGDVDIVGAVQQAMVDTTASNCFKMEIANHGWLHEDFTTIDETESENRLALCNGQIHAVLGTGVTVRTFVPPFNYFNAATVTAATNQGFTHFSSQTSLDPGPFDYDTPSLWHFPVGAFTNNVTISAYFTPVSADLTWNDILAQRARYGYAAVMMHPMEFSPGFNNGTYLNELNQTQLDGLNTLLTRVKQSGMRAVLLGEIEQWFDPTHGNACYSPTTATVSGASTTTSASAAATSTTRAATSSSTSTSGSVATSTSAAATSSSSPSTTTTTSASAVSTTTSTGSAATSSTSTSAASNTVVATSAPASTSIEQGSSGVRVEILMALVLFSIFLVLHM